jgi:glucose-6-phosphate isomerase
LAPGSSTHIPPAYAHRVVNTGSQPLIFVSVYHQCAGHDYNAIEQRGFAQVVVDIDGKPALIPNPRRES